MNIWSDLTTGIHVSSIATIKVVEHEMHIIGTGRKLSTPYIWEAWPLSHGYYVTVRNMSGRTESFQGATFNLALEVASAINRTL